MPLPTRRSSPTQCAIGARRGQPALHWRLEARCRGLQMSSLGLWLTSPPRSPSRHADALAAEGVLHRTRHGCGLLQPPCGLLALTGQQVSMAVRDTRPASADGEVEGPLPTMRSDRAASGSAGPGHASRTDRPSPGGSRAPASPPRNARPEAPPPAASPRHPPATRKLKLLFIAGRHQPFQLDSVSHGVHHGVLEHLLDVVVFAPAGLASDRRASAAGSRRPRPSMRPGAPSSSWGAATVGSTRSTLAKELPGSGDRGSE